MIQSFKFGGVTPMPSSNPGEVAQIRILFAIDWNAEQQNDVDYSKIIYD